ncbi:septum formation initiator family protein [Bacillus salipaludis]|uniref:Septum formation initiator family protein n=1 Tax=Bacillus salipaludis TaxID=2547811 RepID=A0A4R5VJI4_9BACI|nr:septum formation initiator family protein [Bacillus salipaludis]MDQ6595398.1 septum formation initiator family protein [Bacillus salipaludis]TDK57163.1 septum formation initiator family protein [Bacillus salipaludis]
MSAVRKKNVAKIQSTYVEQQEFAEIATARKRKLVVRRLSLFLVFAIFVSYFMISSILTQASMIDAKKAQKKQLGHKLAELKKQQDILKEDIVKLNDDDYIAKLARKEYFFSKKNEIIFNIPENKKEKSTGN